MTPGGVRGEDEEGKKGGREGQGYPWKGTGHLFHCDQETKSKDSENQLSEDIKKKQIKALRVA